MKKIECFEVLGHTDTTEGRGPMKVIARFSTETAANKYIESSAYKKWCVMGHLSTYDKNNIKRTTIIILDSVDELSELENEEFKARALAKLTQQERKVLGLE